MDTLLPGSLISLASRHRHPTHLPVEAPLDNLSKMPLGPHFRIEHRRKNLARGFISCINFYVVYNDCPNSIKDNFID
jgi:hypothetical protein